LSNSHDRAAARREASEPLDRAGVSRMSARAQTAFKAAELKPWRRPVESLTLTLPFPLSVNQLYFNLPNHRGRARTKEYIRWSFLAGTEIMRQRVGRVPGQVWVDFYVEDKPGLRDGDNCCKCMFDALVAQGVIERDDKSIVRGFSFRWSKEIAGARVDIRKATPAASPLDSPS